MQRKLNNIYSLSNIKKIKESPTPRVLLNACTHGSEHVGLQVINYFKKTKITKGTLIVNIANERAVKSKKRFIESDLNRVFPGKEDGNYEERLASKIKPFVDAFDVVVDIHSTESGVSSALIVTKFSQQTKKALRAIAPKRVLFMNTKPKNPHSLISSAKVGIAFEYGKDKDKKTYSQTIQGIERLLNYYGMLESSVTKKTHRKTEFYEVYGQEKKPSGSKISPSIKNFNLVKKGVYIGFNKNNKKIFAKESFYPILFGNNTYETIFGFKARKIR